MSTPQHNLTVGDNWWTRPCGGREVLALSLPLVISTASWTVMHFADRMFLLWYSTDAMAAAMPAGILHFAMLCFPLGVVTYVNTFVAQYQGAKRPERTGLAVWQGVRVGLIAMPLFLATIPLAPAIFRLAGHQADVACLEVVYYQTLSFGAGGALCAAAFSTFFTGRGQTRVVMTVDCTAAVLNVVLDYAWIFGRFGLPAMGIEGAAWATVISQWFRCLVYWRLAMLPRYHEQYGMASGRRFDAALFRRLLRYGGPNGLQLLVEVAAFTLFVLLVGRLGQEAMAATTLAFNVNSVAFVPMLGLGIGLTTIVGRQLGRGHPELAARATWTTMWMAWAYMGTMAALYLLVPDLFLWGHAAGTSPAEFQQLRDVTVVLLRFVAAYCLLDAMNVVFVSTLKGAGDTRFILLVNLVVAFPLVAAVWIGIDRFGGGLMWCWGMVTAWITVLGLVYLLRFLHGHWRTMRVIEPELFEEEEDEVKPPGEPEEACAAETV